jgi:hypothetical protein
MRQHRPWPAPIVFIVVAFLVMTGPIRPANAGGAPSGTILGATIAPALFAQTPPAGQVPFEASLGGSASLAGLRFPQLDVQAIGAGRATLGGAAPTVFNLTPELRAAINVLAPDRTAAGTPFQNGSLTATTAGGNELKGQFSGVATPLDTAGFITITGTWTITGGAGRFSGASGSGTLIAVFNLYKTSFVATVKGSLTPPKP